MTRTEQVLASMLTENTGRHMLDSGGAYGRSWERNQGRDFKSEPETSLSFDYGDITVVHSVFHWLNSRLEYAEHMDNLFHRWARISCNEHKHWLELMEEFSEKRDGTGLYGEGKPMTINTYNGEDMLSQTIQYTYWCDEDGDWVLLQIHGGCDVRGGYTAPRLFRVLEEVALFNNADATIRCLNPECDAIWDTYNSCDWCYEGGSREILKLNEFEMVKEEDWIAEDVEEGEEPDYDNIRETEVEYREVEGIQKVLDFEDKEVEILLRPVISVKNLGIIGKIFVTEDDEGYCPCCGKGKLEALYY